MGNNFDRSERYPRRAGIGQTQFVLQQLGILNRNGQLNTMLVPQRILFVGQSWPVGADPTRFFTSVQAAETRAATLTPTSTDPVLIMIAPGVYTGDVVLESNVYLAAWAGGSGESAFVTQTVTLVGNITWDPVAATTETVALFNGIAIGAGSVLAVDASAKAGGVSAFYFEGSTSAGAPASSIGRATGGDATILKGSFLEAVNITNSALTAPRSLFAGPFLSILDDSGRSHDLSEAQVVVLDIQGTSGFYSLHRVTVALTLTVQGGATLDAEHIQVNGAVSLSNTVTVTAPSSEFNGTVTLANTASLDMSGSQAAALVTLNGSSTLNARGTTFAAGVAALGATSTANIQGAVVTGGVLTNDSANLMDAKNATIDSSVALGGTGAGGIRHTYKQTILATVLGNNPIIFPSSGGLGTASYQVSLTETGAPAGGPPATSQNKVSTGFNLSDSVGGRNFDIIVIPT